MDVVEFREYCLGKPNTTEGTPFGETVLSIQSRRENVCADLAR